MMEGEPGGHKGHMYYIHVLLRWMGDGEHA